MWQWDEGIIRNKTQGLVESTKYKTFFNFQISKNLKTCNVNKYEKSDVVKPNEVRLFFLTQSQNHTFIINIAIFSPNLLLTLCVPIYFF